MAGIPLLALLEGEFECGAGGLAEGSGLLGVGYDCEVGLRGELSEFEFVLGSGVGQGLVEQGHESAVVGVRFHGGCGNPLKLHVNMVEYAPY